MRTLSNIIAIYKIERDINQERRTTRRFAFPVLADSARTQRPRRRAAQLGTASNRTRKRKAERNQPPRGSGITTGPNCRLWIGKRPITGSLWNQV